MVNTASELRNCIDHWDDTISEEELRARRRIVKMAKEILSITGQEE